MTHLIGQSLGRYHILEQLGEGGMATVYKAYDTRLERDVAVKVIRRDAFPPSQLERILKRFEREAKALAKLSHLHIIKVIDYGEHEGSPFLVMEYMPGGTLKQKLGKPMPWQEAARILIPIADALAYAHEHSIIHRDIKPSNILLTEKGQPMLTDFGIAKILETEETATLTGTGIGVGTPEYMAPEQWTGQSTAQSDIYSLGIVFYEMVAGRKPYTADTPAAILLKQANEALPRPGKFATDLPQSVENILIKALAKSPKDRYQSMADFAKALEGLMDDRAITKKSVALKAIDASAHLPAKKVEFKLPAIPRQTAITLGIAVLVIGLFAVFSKSLSGLPAQLLATSTPNETPTPIFATTPAATHTPPTTATPELGIGSTMIGDDGMVMVYVPAGEFTMGSESNSDEQPIHQVYLDAFWIDQTEVTNAMYENCVNAGACVAPNNTGPHSKKNYARNNYFGNAKFNNHPVIFMDWNRASAYCEWADKRLPTEAEWEKAARGTDARTYPWGIESPNNTFLNYNLNVGDATKVGSYESDKSPYGAYDMAGNVLEWVNDWYSDTYYQISPSSNPLGPDTGEYRVLRGSSWLDDEDDPRASLRGASVPDLILIIIGVRCARGTFP